MLVTLCLFCVPLTGCVRSIPIAPPITWATPATITYGTTLSTAQLNAAANIPGIFTYTPALGTLLNAGAQILSVTFTPTDTTDYTTATASVTLQVNQVTPVLTWATPAAITYGTTLSTAQLDAVANTPGIFTYTPAPGTLLDAGAQILSVTFSPTDVTDYSTVTASVTLQVNQAITVLTWPTPAAIAIGTALSSTQLDAIATAQGSTLPIQGSYLYSPGAGTSFTSTGPETLHVTFTPTDAADYTSAEASVTLNVEPVGVAAWGDSLTSGYQGFTDNGSYPNDLQQLINLPVINLGVGGQTSTQIGVRQGGVSSYAAVSGGIIPASGGVTVTFPVGYEPVNVQGPLGGISGTILGVHGLVTLDSTGTIYSFTRTTPGNQVNAPGAPKFVVDTPYASYLPVFWEGRNNYPAESQVLSDIAAQVAQVPSGRDYLVLSIINMNITSEWLGGAGYDQIITLNKQLSNIYKTHYIDVREMLVNSYDSSLATDVSDFIRDEPPTSLRTVLGTGTLGSSIGPGDTTFDVNMTAGEFPIAGILTIDTGANAENVEVESESGNMVTVIRDIGGNNTSHLSGVAVTESDLIHLNANGYQIVADAVAKYLSHYDNAAQH
jgi:hypothetical protein